MSGTGGVAGGVTQRQRARILATIALLIAAVSTRPGDAAVEVRPRTPQSGVPSRIISLVPAVTEMLFAIDAGDQVVGVSSFDTFPPDVATRTRVGALLDPDFERILSLRPDLAVVYGTQSELIGRLNRVRIPTFVYQHAGLSDIGTTIVRVGERVGRGVEARRLAATIEKDLAAVRASAAGPRPRVMLIMEREPGTLRNIFASGGIGFLHDLIELAGGVNVFADVRRENVQVSAELLLARAPDVVIETHYSSWKPDSQAADEAVWRTMASLPAVRTNRIHVVADDRLFVPGPRVAEGARVLAETIGRR